MAPDPYRYFRVEARELIDQLGKGVMNLEKHAAPDRVAGLLRLAHTLKGAAAVVKQREVAERAHAIEDALAPHRETAAPIPRATIDTLLALVDEISAYVSALSLPHPLLR